MSPERAHAGKRPRPAAPLRVYLVESWFYDESPEPDAGWPAECALEVELAVAREKPRELTVLLTLNTGESLPAGVRVTYACDYRVDDDVPGAMVDKWCESLVFDAAPGLLYPYVRQEVARLTASSRLGPYPLPFLPPPLPRREGFELPGPGGDSGGGGEPA